MVQLGTQIESITRPAERLPPEELVRLWESLPEQHRHTFVCHSLSETAADDLLSALERRRKAA